jgi:hypothetical protein
LRLILGASYQAAVKHMHYSMRTLGVFFRVSDHDDGRATVRDAREHIHHGFTVGAVKIARRLVGENQLRVCDERARHGDPLLLAAGQLLRLMTGSVREINTLESRGDSLTSLCARHTQVKECDLDVLRNIKVVDQIEALKYETHSGAPMQGEFFL